MKAAAVIGEDGDALVRSVPPDAPPRGLCHEERAHCAAAPDGSAASCMDWLPEV
jgi:hypothetical protein